MEYSQSANVAPGWGYQSQGFSGDLHEVGFRASAPQSAVVRAPTRQDNSQKSMSNRHQSAFDRHNEPRIGSSMGEMASSCGAASLCGSHSVMPQARSDPSLHARNASFGDDVFGSLGEADMRHDFDVEHYLQQALTAHSQPDSVTPTRTLLVRNVASDADDEELSSIFKSFGEVRTLHTGSKQQGLVVVSFFDLRAAISAKGTLHGTLISNQPLEIHFSRLDKADSQDPYGLSQLQGTIVVYNLDPETTNEHMSRMFSQFGDVKDVSQNPERSSQKFVTFYDVRHAAAALKAMNRAEHLGKLPSHITPQQAASMAYIAGSSPSLVQLAALQLQHNGQGVPVPGAKQWDQTPMQSQQHGVPTSHHVGSPLSEMQLHVSDSASSIGSTAQNVTGHLFPGGPGPSGLGKGIAASMAAAAAAMAARPMAAAAGSGSAGSGHASSASRPSFGGSSGPGAAAAAAAAQMFPQSGSSHNSPLGTPSADQGVQQLLMQNGFSAADAANMLMSLGLSSEPQQLMQGLGSAAGLFGAGGAGGGAGGSGDLFGGASQLGGQNNPGALLAALQEIQVRQVRQQQMAAAQAQAQANLVAGLQAQQAMLAAAAGMGSTSHQLAAAQLLQAAQLNMGAGSPSFMPHGLNATAVQLLQQAGLGLPQGLAMFGSQGLALAGHGHGGRQGSGDMMGHGGMGGRGGADVRGGGGGRLSRRTTDPVAEAERKAQQEKLYALDADKIYSGQDRRTTLMIKNIPNKYTQKMLLATIDEHFHGTYDFFYLPIDFKNKCNVGYAFINMTQPVNIIPLVERFNLKKWERFNSEKVCHISYARIQGRSALVSHFQNSSLMHEDKRCRPILFVLDGSEATGEQEAFPPPNPGTMATGTLTTSSAAGPGPSAVPSMSNSSSHQNLTNSSSMASIGDASCGGSSNRSCAK